MNLDRAALVLGLLLAAVEAGAMTLRPPALESNVLAAGGKVIFCQPDKSFTVLDLGTGEVLVRDTDADCQGWLQMTDAGPLLSTHWSWYRMIDVEDSIAQGRMIARWEMGGAKEAPCRSSRVIEDRLVCARSQDFVVESRSLADNHVRWTYEAPGAVMDIVPQQGRLLLQSGDYQLARDISVVDLRTGRPLFREAIAQDAQFAVRSFDGQRVLLAARPPEGSACAGAIVRTLTPAGDRMIARDACGEDDRPRPMPTPSLREGWNGSETSLRFHRWRWIEGIVKGGTTWFAYARDGLELADVHEVEGRLVLERRNRKVASLECLEAASGRPLWTYVYNPYRCPSREWDSAKPKPPKGTVPAGELRPPEDEDRRRPHPLEQARYPGRLVFDPTPLRAVEPEPSPTPIP